MKLPTTPGELHAALVDFDVGVASRLMRALERGERVAATQLQSLPPLLHHPHVIGVTGAGGVGKSTLIAKLLGHWRGQGLTIGVLAVDPSSTVSGGAVLGDRVRMAAHAQDQRVFIRSLGSRGAQGGVAAKTAELIDVMQHMRCDIVVVETLGVGQDEVAVQKIVDTTVLVVMPGAGDEVQAMKAGLLEVADLLVVNKADLANVGRAVSDLRAVARWSTSSTKMHRHVLTTVATTGQGVAELARELAAAHDLHPCVGLRSTGLVAIETELQTRVNGPVASWLRETQGGQSLCQRVMNGEASVSEAVDEAWRAVSAGSTKPSR